MRKNKKVFIGIILLFVIFSLLFGVNTVWGIIVGTCSGCQNSSENDICIVEFSNNEYDNVKDLKITLHP